MTDQEKVKVLRDAIFWIAQTLHQGNHTESSGTFRECPKSTCSHAKEVLDETDEKKSLGLGIGD